MLIAPFNNSRSHCDYLVNQTGQRGGKGTRGCALFKGLLRRLRAIHLPIEFADLILVEAQGEIEQARQHNQILQDLRVDEEPVDVATDSPRERSHNDDGDDDNVESAERRASIARALYYTLPALRTARCHDGRRGDVATLRTIQSCSSVHRHCSLYALCTSSTYLHAWSTRIPHPTRSPLV